MTLPKAGIQNKDGLAWAHQSKMSGKQMLAMPFYHPVIEEGLRTALRKVLAQVQEPVLVAAWLHTTRIRATLESIQLESG